MKKNHFTRLGAVLLTLALLLSLCACGSSAPAEATAEPSEAPVEVPEAPVETEEPEQAEETCDIVIVGGGLAGMTAACELAAEHSDLSVVLVEKNATLGGDLPYSGGVLMGFNEETYTGKDSHEVADASEYVQLYTDTVQELVDAGVLQDGEYTVNEELIANSFGEFQKAVDLFFDIGVEFPEGFTEYGVRRYQDFASICGGDDGMDLSATDFCQRLTDYVMSLGIDVRVSTEATGLVVEDGAVKGVTVTSGDGDYTIHSDGVLLATGGISASPELIAEYDQGYENTYILATGLSTGDAFTFTRQFNTPVVGHGVFGGLCSNDSTYDLLASHFMVGSDGNRFCKETDTPYIMSALIHKLGDGVAWTICDQDYADAHADELQLKLDEGDVTVYDSIDELAAAEGIDAEGLKATIEAYNAAVDAGEELEYGLAASDANRIVTAPFYCEKAADYDFETIPGIQVNENLQVLDGDGNVVPGLYAAGEAVYGNIVTEMYPQSGAGLSWASASGTWAGDCVASAGSSVYTATAPGRNGDITVSVTISKDGTITGIETSSQETAGIGIEAMQTLTQQVLDSQAIPADVISGATLSSTGFITALTDALAQSGLDFSTASTAAQDYVTESDVLIVGGGMAGVSSAIRCAAAGLNVTLIEKEGVLGGSSARCDGMLLAGGTALQAESGIEDSAEQFYQEMLELHTEEYVEPDMLKVYTYNSADIYDWLTGQGVNFEYVWCDHLETARSHAAEGAGAGMMSVLIANLESYDNVNIYKNTRATELLMEDGAVTGVKATGSDGSEVEFHAPYTVLATGGYAADPEMVLELSGDIMQNYTTDSANNVGDGYNMCKAAGAEMFDTVDCLAMNYYPIGTEYIGCWTYDLLFVTPDAQRHFSEMTYATDRTSDVLHLGYDHEYAILDQADYELRAADVDAGIEQGLAFKADSVEDLAAQLDMDAATLQATIDRYNELCDKGSDDDCGKPAEYMNKIEGDTLYALTLRVNITDTYSGPRINTNAQVISTSGEPIEGLYACGAISLWEVTDYHYADCGCSILNSAVFAAQAANDIIAKSAA